MNDAKKTKAQLIAELKELRRQAGAGKGKPKTESANAAEAGLQRLSSQLAAAPLPEGKLPEKEDAAGGTAPRALLVGGASLFAEMEDALAAWGIETDNAQKGGDALAKLKAGDYDVALISLCPGDLSGLELLSAIKERFPETECIMLLERKPDEATLQALRANAFCYFQKPFDAGQALLALQRAAEKKREGKALREGEARYYSIIENIQDTYIRTDKNGIIIMASPSAARVFGYDSPQDMLGVPVASTYRTLEARQTVQKELQAHGKVNDFVCEGVKRDGTVFWTSITAQYYYDKQGQRLGVEGFGRDITERKRAETLLQESETRFREMIENAQDIIYRTDIEGRLIYLNPSALRCLGYKEEIQLLGKNYIEIAAPDWRKNLQRFFERQLVTRMLSSYSEFIAQTTDGQRIWLGQNTQLLLENNEIVGIQAVARDITQIKAAYEALDVARNQALAASQLKSQLLARVSHELRTPLSSVLGYAELLMYDSFGELNQEQKDAAAQIIASANYLTNMVEDLLDEAQMTSKSLVLADETFRPAEIVEKAESTLQVLAANKGLKLITSVAPELPPKIHGDLKRLQQIIINLAGNAIKFTTKGEVRIKLGMPKPTHWSIQVEDTGVGIPQEAQAYIFEPFRQASDSITRNNRGAGLGLSISKQLVDLMGGRIALQSEVGKGSCFTITLPLKKNTEASNE